MPTDKRPPYIRIADEAADAARVADQRQRIPTIGDGSRPPGVPSPAGGSLRFDPDSLERPAVERQRIPTIPARLSPAAMRRLGAAVGDLAESMGGSLTAPPGFGTEYADDGSVAVTLTLRVRVADLNRHAAEPTDPTPR